MNFYNIVVHAHSGLRWILLLVLVVTILLSLKRWLSKSNYQTSDKKWYLLSLIFSHIQLIIGLYLYFVSPRVVFNENTMSDADIRFYTVEHISINLIAIILITIGYRVTKSIQTDFKKYKRLFWYFFIALVLILSRIPWPGMVQGAGWF
jgi:hypothetical protein